jgi:hypothetical protein
MPFNKPAIAPASGLSDVSLSCFDQREHACALRRALRDFLDDKSADRGSKRFRR